MPRKLSIQRRNETRSAHRSNFAFPPIASARLDLVDIVLQKNAVFFSTLTVVRSGFLFTQRTAVNDCLEFLLGNNVTPAVARQNESVPGLALLTPIKSARLFATQRVKYLLMLKLKSALFRFCFSLNWCRSHSFSIQ